MKWVVALCILVSVQSAMGQSGPTTRGLTKTPEVADLDWLRSFPEGSTQTYHCSNESRLRKNKASGDLEMTDRVEGTLHLSIKRKLADGRAEMLCELRPATWETGGKVIKIAEGRTLAVTFSSDGTPTFDKGEVGKLRTGENAAAYDMMLKATQILWYAIPDASARASEGALEWQGAPEANRYNYVARLVGGAAYVNWFSAGGELPSTSFILSGRCLVYQGMVYTGAVDVSVVSQEHRVAGMISLRVGLMSRKDLPK